jgi:hypothetical protein
MPTGGGTVVVIGERQQATVEKLLGPVLKYSSKYRGGISVVSCRVEGELEGIDEDYCEVLPSAKDCRPEHSCSL